MLSTNLLHVRKHYQPDIQCFIQLTVLRVLAITELPRVPPPPNAPTLLCYSSFRGAEYVYWLISRNEIDQQ